MGITIRKMRPTDVDNVLAVEALSFHSEAWVRADFEYLAGDPDGAFVTLVAENDGLFCGYICASFVCGELEIASVAVTPEFRRRGVARSLIERLERDLLPERAFLEVRKSNEPAVCLYESLGFSPCGLRRNYYDSPPEDAVVMAKEY